MIEYIKEYPTKEDYGVDKGIALMGIYKRVYLRPKLVVFLKLFGALSVIYVAFAYLATCAWLYQHNSVEECVRLVLVSVVPFILVSALRLILNYERPYELVDLKPFEKMRKRRKAGKSFPSRHVFSAFLIGTLLLSYSIPAAAATLAVGLFLAVERALLGIHFPKDVFFGGVFGVLFGLVGMLVL